MHVFKLLFNKKYRFFQKKINDVTASLWELDFKIAKARGMREGSRQSRDRAIDAVQRLKNTPTNPEGLPELTKQIEAAEAQVKGFEAQMQLIDDQVNGTEGEDAQKGLLEYAQGLAELKSLYREHLNKI